MERDPPCRSRGLDEAQRWGAAMRAIILDLCLLLGISPFTLQHLPNIYDVVHMKYFDDEPLKLDFVISFPEHGFHLCFDPLSQRPEGNVIDLADQAAWRR